MSKRIFSIISILVICTTTVFALEIRTQPPEEYVKNLQTCKVSTINDIGAKVYQYNIKGVTPDGKCKVTITDHDNFENYEVYKMYREISQIMQESAGITNPVIKSQPQMIKESKLNKVTYNCSFTPRQCKDLYYAFLKNDGQGGESFKKLENGGYSFGFDTTKMSSYQNLMLNYQPSTCKATMPASFYK